MQQYFKKSFLSKDASVLYSTSILLISFLLALLAPNSSQANQRAELEWIVETMVRLCVLGGDQFSITSSSSVNGEITLQSLSRGGQVEGEFHVERTEVEGLVSGIDNSITALAANQASEARQCLAPVREYLLAKLVTSGSSLDVNTPPRASERVFEVRSAKSMKYNPGRINEHPDGFKCESSSMTMDYVICSFQEVYDVNTQHAVVWWSTLRKLTRAEKDLLVADQREWIDRMLTSCNLPLSGRPSRNQAISSAECVRQQYIARTSYIRNYAT